MDVRQRTAAVAGGVGGSSNHNDQQQSLLQSKEKSKIRQLPPNQLIKTFLPLFTVFGIILLLCIGGILFILPKINDEDQMNRSDRVDPTNNNEFLIEQEAIDQLRRENEKLKKQLAKLESSPSLVRKAAAKDNDNNNHNNNNKDDDKRNRIQQLRDYKIRMHEEIQRISKRQLITKYGKGPHYVDIVVLFDPKSNVYTTERPGGTIRIELAPVDEMPAVVYHFLEQVSEGLMDGCSFHRNAGHVVQGGPSPNFYHTTAKFKDFKAAALSSVPFQEYSANFPHKKYTLGYAGRPGGPDFYVSTQDNTRNHGPGGQGSYADPSEADPCFAKVIDGFDIVDLIHKSTTKPGGYKAMEHNVAIKQMKLVTKQ